MLYRHKNPYKESIKQNTGDHASENIGMGLSTSLANTPKQYISIII
jgi:hypothetical protein